MNYLPAVKIKVQLDEYQVLLVKINVQFYESNVLLD
jgi:hypothetical protein